MSSVIALPAIDQTNVSAEIRAIIKRMAADGGGLVKMMQRADIPYRRAYEQANRNQGVLVDFAVALEHAGIDDPLRIAVDRSKKYELAPKVKFLRKAHPARTIREIELDIHHAVSALTSLVESTAQDGRFKRRDVETIKSEVHKIKVKFAELEAGIEGGKR